MVAKKDTAPDYAEMTIEELQAVVDAALAALEEKKDARRRELLAELESLGGVPQPSRRSRSVAPTSDESRSRASPAPKYRSKRDAEVTWSGRGALPRWMKEEMEEMNLSSKDDFLIQ